uniref:Uncharacterized protein n=1 Tax=Glossina pallidipes TaxID=7398 RepID=A0A1B0AH27_GLOPL
MEMQRSAFSSDILSSKVYYTINPDLYNVNALMRMNVIDEQDLPLFICICTYVMSVFFFLRDSANQQQMIYGEKRVMVFITLKKERERKEKQLTAKQNVNKILFDNLLEMCSERTVLFVGGGGGGDDAFLSLSYIDGCVRINLYELVGICEHKIQLY